jgi:SAM-dependent methyltransferase
MYDKVYWEKYYSKQNAELKPSLFAQYVTENVLKEHNLIIELGCGNGRDAIFFANENFKVYAIDQVFDEIKFLKKRYTQLKNITFECADFTNLDNSRKFDVVYSRFTMHSITESQEEKVVLWAFQNLNPNGIFCIEVRGQKNEIFGKGKPVKNQPNAFIFNEHYRRFLKFEVFINKLESMGFSIEFAAEKKGFAPFNGENETFIRIIAKK